MERAAAFVNSVRNAFIKDGFRSRRRSDGPRIETIVKHIEANRDELLVIGFATTKSERLYLGRHPKSIRCLCSVLIVRGARI